MFLQSERTLNTPRLVVDGTKVARCEICAGYINPFCEVTHAKWYCSLCGQKNAINRSMVRY